MMKHILYALLFVSTLSFGQCPTETVNLFSQQQVDDFIVDYPNCTEIGVQIWISGSDITNLQGLNNIERIGVGTGPSGLNISNCPNLISFAGLESLEYVNYFSVTNSGLINFLGLESLEEVSINLKVYSNPNLINFEGLDVIQHIESLDISFNDNLENFVGLENFETAGLSGNFYIQENPTLNSIDGLQNLEFIGLELKITDCDQLENLDPLINLTHVAGVFINNNSSLNSIMGLSNVNASSLGSQISIFDNPNLSECDITFICDNFDNPDLFIGLNNNAPGCSTNQEVMDDCEIVDIPDFNFLNLLLNYSPIIDTNADGNIQYTEAEAFTGNLNASGESIQNFKGVEAFINIIGFDGSDNQITELDLSSNSFLTSVVFENNTLLESVNLKNGNNTSITNFQGLNCPNLQFICVDDIAYAETNYTSIDPQVSFVEDCSLLSTDSNDLVSFESYLMPNPTSGIFNVILSEGNELQSVSVFSITGAKVMETASEIVDSSQWLSGVYFVQISTSEGTVTKKLVKE